MGVKSVINAANTTAPIAAATDEYTVIAFDTTRLVPTCLLEPSPCATTGRRRLNGSTSPMSASHTSLVARRAARCYQRMRATTPSRCMPMATSDPRPQSGSYLRGYGASGSWTTMRRTRATRRVPRYRCRSSCATRRSARSCAVACPTKRCAVLSL